MLHVVTDSACVHWWVSNTLTGKAHVNTKAAGTMLVRWQLGTRRTLVVEYMLTVDITLVKSFQNCADSLTRIPQRWLDIYKNRGEPVLESCGVVKHQLSKVK